MRKYLRVNKVTGFTIEMCESDFVEFLAGTLECELVTETDDFITYNFPEYILINDKIAEYDE